MGEACTEDGAMGGGRLTRRQWLAGSAVVAAAAPAVVRAAERRDAFVAKVERYLAASKAPGLGLGLVEDGEISLVRGFGVRSLVTGERLTPETLLRVGSVSKPFTAITLLRLVDEGKVELDAPAVRYVPEFKVDGRITVRQLLSHTAGLADILTDRPDLGDGSLRAWVGEFEPAIRTFEPGSVISYSSAGVAVAAAVVENLTKRPFRLAADETLAKLGLSTSTFDIDRVLTRPHSTPHEAGRQGPLAMAAERVSVSRHDIASGMMWATPREITGFARWLIHGPGPGGVISGRAFDEMRRPVLTLRALQHGYGLCLGVDRITGETVLEHGGAIWGHQSRMETLPSRGFGVVVLTNYGSPAGLAGLTEAAFADLAGVTRPKPVPAEIRPEHLGRFERLTARGLQVLDLRRVEGGLASQRPDGSYGATGVPLRPDAFQSDTGILAYVRDASGQVIGVNLNGRHFRRL